MIKPGKQKIINSLFFLILTVASIYLIVKNRNSSNYLLYIMLGVAAVYLGWAAVYHKIDKSLTLPIFVEYLLTATLVLILILGILV